MDQVFRSAIRRSQVNYAFGRLVHHPKEKEGKGSRELGLALGGPRTEQSTRKKGRLTCNLQPVDPGELLNC